MSDRCPLTGSAGRELRCRLPEELAASYQTYVGNALPAEFIKKYFQKPIQEYESQESGLRWFSPSILAEDDFYNYLAATYSWYYDEESWDKQRALGFLQRFRTPGFIDVGCGEGMFLDMARQAGVHGIGIDMNPKAIAQAQSSGHQAYLATDLPANLQLPPTLCLFQTLEHVSDPLGMVDTYVKRSKCKNLIITVPCFETYLGYASDPLVWPPHHVTFWSEKALRILAELIGFRVTKICYQPMVLGRFISLWRREPCDRLPLGPIRLRNPGRSPLPCLVAKYLLGRLHRSDWASRSHSVLAILQR